MAGAVAILSGFIVCNGFGQVDICGTSAAEGLRAVAEGLRTGPGSVFRQEGNRLRPGFGTASASGSGRSGVHSKWAVNLPHAMFGKPIGFGSNVKHTSFCIKYVYYFCLQQ